MSFETSKCTARRMAQGHLWKLVGEGLDIGAGNDAFRPIAGHCRPWDQGRGDGDASSLQGVSAGSLDYIYSSHCLEHLADPVGALKRWCEVLKPGGFLYVAVPDFDLYEGGEKIRNRFHKAAFTLHRPPDMRMPLYNVLDLINGPMKEAWRPWYVGLCDDNYDPNLPSNIDQTQRGAVCHIEFMAQKK